MFIGETYISNAVQEHVRLFVLSVFWGIGIAVTYDLLRIWRRIIRTPRLVYYVQEVLFGIAQTLWIFHLLYIYDDGAVRVYTMLGLLGGLIIYEWLIGRWLADWLGRKILKIVNSLQNLLKNKGKQSRM